MASRGHGRRPSGRSVTPVRHSPGSDDASPTTVGPRDWRGHRRAGERASLGRQRAAVRGRRADGGLGGRRGGPVPDRQRGTRGLGTALRDRAREIQRQRFLDNSGRLLFQVDLPSFWARVGPCLAIGRGDLHQMMRESVDVRLGTTVVALKNDGPVTIALYADGSSGEYDLVVGADGIHSWMRCSGADRHHLGAVVGAAAGGEPRRPGSARRTAKDPLRRRDGRHRR